MLEESTTNVEKETVIRSGEFPSTPKKKEELAPTSDQDSSGSDNESDSDDTMSEAGSGDSSAVMTL